MSTPNEAPGSNPVRQHCLKAIAYVKMNLPLAPDAQDKEVHLPFEDTPVFKELGNNILAAYLVDQGDHFEYIRQRDLAAAGLSEDELHRQAVYNLSGIAQQHVKVQPYGNVYAVLMGGNFESSLILFDSFWKDSCAHLVPNGYVVAFPARDILAFTDAGNDAGIRELGELCQRAAGPNITHRLTETLFTYRDGQWVPYQPN